MKRALQILLALVLLAIAPFAWQSYQGNFHVVAEGEVYRSGQLDPGQLAERIEERRIRSVLNLRGPDPGKEWYEQEVAAARAKGVVHADFLMFSGSRLDQAQMDQLVSLMGTLPKPMLIHCWGGADRTGFASALYLYAFKDKPAEEAAGQLSARFGHVPLLRPNTAAMDDNFRRYTESAPR